MSAEEDLVELARIKERIEDLNEEKAEIEARLIGEMELAGHKTVKANSGDLTGTLVKSTTITVDEEALRKVLTAPVWKKVTKTVLDKEKLEAHIVTGEVDPNVVASVSTEKDRKPYIRVSGSFRQKKAAGRASTGKRPVTTKNSNGGTKPAARRVVKKKTK